MCNQRDGYAGNGTLGHKGNGGSKNVTQRKKSGAPDSIGGTRPNKGTQNCKGNLGDASAASGGKPRNSRPHRPGSAVTEQSRASGSRGSNKKGHTNLQLQLSSPKHGGKNGSGNRTAGVSRQHSEDRPNDVVQRVWKASEVRTCLRTDNRKLAWKVDQEFVLVTTWAALFEDLCIDALPAFRSSIEDYGLVGTIIRFQRIASQLLNDSTPSVLDTDLVTVLKSISLKDALQLLRFGKRYTPVAWDSEMERDVFAKFHARNNRAKMFNRREMPYWLVKRLHEVGTLLCEAALGKKTFADFVGERSYVGDLDHIPNGTTAEGLRSPFEKWWYVSALWSELEPTACDAVNTLDFGQRDNTYSKLVMVPKDYRGPRIIMEELLEVTLQQSMIADAIHRIINTENRKNAKITAAHAIKLNDQSQNQDMAKLGAEFGYFSTLDLKDASDSITYQLIYAVFPYDVAEAILYHATKIVELPDGKRYPLWMPCTMGSRLTVPVQSLIYWVIVVVAAIILVDLGVLPDLKILDDCSVYNDDIVVPYVMYDTVCDLLELCGLIVNHDKSYTDGHPFRESCGVDMYLNFEVTSIYWPRKELDMANDEIPSLCALHNRLYSIGAMHAAACVESFIVNMMPKVPRVAPGSEVIGLYSRFPERRVVPYVGNDVTVRNRYRISYEEGMWSSTLIVRKARKDAKYGTVRDLATFDELIEIIESYKKVDPRIREIRVYHNIIGGQYESVDPSEVYVGGKYWLVPIEIGARKIELPDVYRVHQPTLIQTFNNRKIGKLTYDKNIITQAYIESIFEIFEYQRWLRLGSEYYDDWCKVLRVTQPSRLANRLYASGYKVGTTSFTLVEEYLTQEEEKK